MSIKLKISALGELRQYLYNEREVDLEENPRSLKSLFIDEGGIPNNETRLCFVVNKEIQSATYSPKDNDSIVILKMCGAG